MKPICILIIALSLSLSSLSFAAANYSLLNLCFGDDTSSAIEDSMRIEGNAFVKRLSKSKKNGALQVKLRVTSGVNLHAYPAVVAYIDGKELNEYKMNYYAHMTDMVVDYTIEFPLKYKNRLDEISFRVVQSNGTFIDLIR
jgi:hypothetical protein